MKKSYLLAIAIFLLAQIAAQANALSTEQNAEIPSGHTNVADPDEQAPAFVHGVNEEDRNKINDPRGFTEDHVTGPSLIRPGYAQEDRVGLPTPFMPSR